MPLDPLIQLENALGAALLRADLLGAERPELGERYRIERFLGRGASGLVVRARDRRLERDVALKLMPDGPGTDDALREARTLAQLDHENVVRVFDAELGALRLGDEERRVAYVSMQLLTGEPARAWAQREPRDAGEVLAVFCEAGRGLAAAHEAGLVHRDVKPDHVFVGDDGVARILDFGFAVSAERAEPSILGTDLYLAPEAPTTGATPASDQLAFARSLTEMLTGALDPLDATFPPDVPPGVRDALVRATREDPSARFASLAELVDALEDEGASEPRRPWKRIGLVALALACMVAAIASTCRSTPRATLADPCAPYGGLYRLELASDEPARAGFRLELTSLGDCRVRAALSQDWAEPAGGRRTTFRPPAIGRAVIATLEPDAGGARLRDRFTIEPPSAAPAHDLLVGLRIEGDRVEGTVEGVPRPGTSVVRFRGALRGRRIAREIP